MSNTILPTSFSLLDRLQTADPAAWDRLHFLYAPMLRRWIGRWRLQPADAEDVLQNLLTVVVRRLREFQHNGRTGAFRAWLRTILANCVREFLRKANRQPTAADEATLAELELPDSDLAEAWDREHDRYLVGRLLELIREEFTCSAWDIFLRYAIDGKTPAEVADEFETTPNAVCIVRSRVLRRLREEAGQMLDGGT